MLLQTQPIYTLKAVKIIYISAFKSKLSGNEQKEIGIRTHKKANNEGISIIKNKTNLLSSNATSVFPCFQLCNPPDDNIH